MRSRRTPSAARTSPRRPRRVGCAACVKETAAAAAAARDAIAALRSERPLYAAARLPALEGKEAAGGGAKPGGKRKRR